MTKQTAYQLCRQVVEQTCPTTYGALAPRLYRGADGWESPSVPAVQLAGTMESYNDPNFGGSIDGFTKLVAITAAQCIHYGTPTFFVGRDLLEAVSLTEPPPDFQWTDIQFPFPAGVFLLPVGAVTAGQWRFNYVTWCVVKQDELIKIPRGQSLVFNNSAIVFTTSSTDDPNFQAYTQTLDATTWPWAQMPPDDMIDPHHNSNLSGEESDLMHRLSKIAIGLLLVTNARPELQESGECQKRHTKRGGREIWSPNWVGRAYRLVRKPPAGGTHSSPRMHWRKGHIRDQAFGEKLSLRKTIWIEPRLVGK
jgi:hypothetical protein